MLESAGLIVFGGFGTSPPASVVDSSPRSVYKAVTTQPSPADVLI